MTNSYIERENQFGAHHYAPIPVVICRGEGVYAFDENNKRYLDMMSAYSAVSHGHCHPKILKALHEQAAKISIPSRAYYNEQLGFFLKELCELTGFDMGLPMVSGAEAVETALKAARKWAYTIKGVEKDKAEIIACNGNFHGRTISIVGMSSEEQYKSGFGPFPSGFKLIPYGDIDALEKAITKNTAAFIVEPIQGEAGIIVPPVGYLKKAAEICKKHNVLLICDEIQTGLGRTGKLFAFQHEGIKPDAVTLGKALGGGVLPVSMFLAKKEVMDVFTPGDHGSTFGGNPLASAVGRAAIKSLVDEKLTENAAEMGDYFMQQLKSLSSPLIKEIRGKGLLIGIEIIPDVSARKVVLELLQNGILSKETHHTTIRLAPPLIITKQQIDEAVVALKKTLESMTVT